MKHYISLTLIILLTLGLCSCKHEKDEELAKIDSIVENVQAESQNSEGDPSGEEITKTEFEESELFKLPIFGDAPGSLRKFPQNYEEFSKRVEDAIIVAGRAFGTRGHNPAILTHFLVEKVYRGEPIPQKIIVQEDYALYYDKNNDPYLARLGYEYLPLVNDQPTLLFAYPHSKKEGVYVTDLIPIPLPKDHQNYDEEYLTELLDYFRGDRTAYKYPKLTIGETIIDGNPVPTSRGGVYWEKQEISDEALLEQMDDHILLRLATDYKIKIWPFDHAQYPEERNFSDYFMKMSYPPTNKP